MTFSIKSFVPFLGHGDSVLNIFGHPYFIARFSLRRNFKLFVSDTVFNSVLDIGCGATPYRDLFINSLHYHGLEIDRPRNRSNPNVTFFYDGVSIPLDDLSYDAILCSQVLEHSFEPEMLLHESFRLLKPGGSLFISIPFIWPEHEQPYDSQRFTLFGLQYRLNMTGFNHVKIKKSSIGLLVLLQLSIEWTESLVRRLLLSSRLLFLAWRFLTILPYTIINLFAFICLHLSRSNNSKSCISSIQSFPFPSPMPDDTSGGRLKLTPV